VSAMDSEDSKPRNEAEADWEFPPDGYRWGQQEPPRPCQRLLSAEEFMDQEGEPKSRREMVIFAEAYSRHVLRAGAVQEVSPREPDLGTTWRDLAEENQRTAAKAIAEVRELREALLRLVGVCRYTEPHPDLVEQWKARIAAAERVLARERH
jgi:hypothetical protein